MMDSFKPRWHICPTCHGEGTLLPFEPNLEERGKRLKLSIMSLGMSQEEFAQELGVTTKHLSQIVNGKVGGSNEFWKSVDEVLFNRE
jgi:DNA-binding XRE family transcriptional regulator